MPKQPAIPDLRDAMKKKVTRREMFLAEMDAAAGADCAALPEGGPRGRPSADAAGDDAAYILPAKLVRAERSDGGGEPVR